MDRPEWSTLASMVDDLKRAVGSLGETQQKMMRVTGTGWSADRLIKATVGARGQLTDLQIDPRVFRDPDSGRLAESILAAARAAVADANAQSMALVDATVPADLRRGPFGGADSLGALITRHDGDPLDQGGPDG
jgi:DNA-binding protein YbaB